MSEATMFCPECETRIRFPNGVPDRNWIDCPRCGEEISLAGVSRHWGAASPRRSPRKDSDREVRRPRRERPRPSRRPSAPRSRSARKISSQADGNAVGIWFGVIGGSAGVLGLILGVIFFVNSKKVPAPAAKEDQLAETADEPANTPANEPVEGPSEVVVADSQPGPPQNDGQPAPTLPPGPDGMIPVPPAEDNQKNGPDNANWLKYGWKTGDKFAFRTAVKAEVGDEVNEVRGMTTYQVLGPGAAVVDLFEQEDIEEMGSGSGFVVHPDGYLMTCAHVVEDASKVEVELEGRTYLARVIEINTQRDLALIRIAARNLPVLPLGDSARMELAQPVRVVGFPLSDVLGTSIKITQGSVAGFLDQTSGRMIQVDASMNPGNSGGPLVNDRGEVVGVASAGYFGASISEVGLAVPANDVRSLLQKNGVSFHQNGSKTTWEGPELARQVTPSVAFLKVTSGTGEKNRLVLQYSSSQGTTKRRSDGRPVPAGLSASPQSDSGKLVVSEHGSILFAESTRQNLPFGLGPMSHIAIEPLSPHGETTWTTQRLTMITQVKKSESRHDPYSRFGPGSHSRFGRPWGRPPRPFDRNDAAELEVHLALEVCEYELGTAIDQTQVINKQYDFRTVDDPDRPYLHISGEGTVRFDRSGQICDQISYKLNMQVRAEKGVTVQIPIDVLCERLSDQELEDHNRRVAELTAQAREQAKAWAQASLPEQLAILNDPQSNFTKKYNALHAIKRTTPDEKHRKEVLDAVEPLLEDSNSALQSTAIDTFGEWGIQDRATVLIEMLEGSSRQHRRAAMKALGNIGGKKSAEAVAEQLTDQTDRLAAVRALKQMGSPAEAPVLELIDHSEQQVRLYVYQILGEIGGPQSIAALEDKEKNDPHPSNRAAAKIALRKLKDQ